MHLAAARSIGAFFTPLRAAGGEAYRIVERSAVGFFQEISEISFAGTRARQASITSLVIALSVAIASAMHLPDVWWAAISGFMSTQATRPASVSKALLRIAGTVVGAVLAVALIGRLAYDPVACCLALFIMSSIGMLGMMVSPHGYAWLFCGATFSLVVLMSLVDPLNAFIIAVDRTIEVVVGTVVAIIAAIALAPEGALAAKREPPGWTDLLGAQWPAVMHAIRSGIAVAVLPLAWSAFDLPGLPTMAITMASVLAIPILSDHPSDNAKSIAERAIQRLLGCLFGGLPALVLLAAPLTSLPPWLLTLAIGTWVGSYVQGSTRGVGYVGTQAALVFIVALVQGEGPPSSIMPAIDRLLGITLGLIILLILNLLIQPDDRTSA